MKIVVLLAALLSLSACTSAISPERDDVVLVRAKLVSTVYRPSPGEGGEMSVGINIVAERFKILNALVGHTDESEAKYWEYASGELRLGVVYFLAETRRDDALVTRWSESDLDGLCMDEGVQKEFALVGEIAALQKDYPCTEHHRRG